MSWDNTNRGSLFKNDRKQSENHPDFKGSINVNGVDYWMSAWTKEIKQGEKAGQKFMSLSIQPKNQSSDSPRGSFGDGTSTNGNPSLNEDSELPF